MFGRDGIVGICHRTVRHVSPEEKKMFVAKEGGGGGGSVWRCLHGHKLRRGRWQRRTVELPRLHMASGAHAGPAGARSAPTS
jgi:hypothetical protein